MPSHVLHVMAGEDSLAKAGRALPAGVLTRAFALGCQATDVFYHNQRTKPSGLHFGTLSHRRGAGSLLAALARESAGFSDDDREVMAAYLLGYATHPALDRALHPWIVSRAGFRRTPTGDGDPYASCHPFLERLLDIAFLHALRGERIATWGIAARLDPGQDALDAVARAFSGALDDVYVHSTDDARLPERARNAFFDALHVFRATDPSLDSELGAAIARWSNSAYARRGASILYPLDGSVDIPRLEAEDEPWLDPRDGSKRFEGPMDLYLSGVALATKAIDSTWPLAEALREGSIPDPESLALAAREVGDAALNLPGPDGSDTPPVACSPFPLARALDLHLESLRSALDSSAERLHTVPR